MQRLTRATRVECKPAALGRYEGSRRMHSIASDRSCHASAASWSFTVTILSCTSTVDEMNTQSCSTQDGEQINSCEATQMLLTQKREDIAGFRHIRVAICKLGSSEGR